MNAIKIKTDRLRLSDYEIRESAYSGIDPSKSTDRVTGVRCPSCNEVHPPVGHGELLCCKCGLDAKAFGNALFCVMNGRGHQNKTETNADRLRKAVDGYKAAMKELSDAWEQVNGVETSDSLMTQLHEAELFLGNLERSMGESEYLEPKCEGCQRRDPTKAAQGGRFCVVCRSALNIKPDSEK